MINKKTILAIGFGLLIAILFAIFLKKETSVPIHLQPSTYNELPGWEHANPVNSLSAFQISCKPFLRASPEAEVGSKHIHLQVKDWLPACKKAVSLNNPSPQVARAFFEKWFTPVQFYKKRPVKGLFTGYYMALLKGSLEKTETYNVPIYGIPNDLIRISLGQFDPELKFHRPIVGRVQGKRFIPYYTREEINRGAMGDAAPVIVWTDNKIDRLFLEIQGSGVVELEDGSMLYIGYEGQNGASYTPIAGVLIKQGVMTKDNASMQRIRRYFEKHPEKIDSILNLNQSFVFFSKSKQKAALGAQGVPLTPGYSMAVDRKWVPLGTPLWLNATRPSQSGEHQHVLQRLLIAQDTGGAIRGPVRGDVYWGAGERAAMIAGRMKDPGYYWLLLPKSVIPRITR